MAQANPFDQFDTAAAPTRVPVYGAPPKPDKPDAPRTTYRTLSPDEIKGRNLNPSHAWQISSEGNIDDLGDTSPKPKEAKALREGDATKLATMGDTLSTMTGLLGSFKDDYAGNTFTGGLENSIQSKFSSFGTPGQRDWWANMANIDNLVRNSQFGASLTPGEKAEFEKTTISPSMDPQIIRDNLKRRAQILAQAADRRVKGLKAAGWNAEEIDAYVGTQIEDALGLDAPPPADKKDDPGVGLTFGGDDTGGPPNGEVKLGYRKNEDGSLAPVFGKPGTNVSGMGLEPLTAADQAEIEHQKAVSASVAQDNKMFGDPGLGVIARNGVTAGFDDEAAGVGGAIGSALQGKNPIEGYTIERDAARQRLEQARQNTGALGTATEFVAGAAGLGPGVLVGPQAPRTIVSLAKEGAAVGAGYGFGSGEGTRGSLIGAATGAATGGSLGAGGGKLSEYLANRTAKPASEAAQNLALGEKYGLDLSLGDVGGRGAKMVERSLDAQPASAAIMNAPRKALSDQVENAVGNVANEFGAPTSFRGMGEAAQSGANRWLDKFATVTGKLYDRIPIKDVAEATIGSTRSALASLSSKIGSNPELSDLLANPKFAKYLDALTPKMVEAVDASGVPYKRLVETGGKLSWNDLKAFRTDIGEQLGEAMFTDGTRKGELRALYSALSSDMEATAAAQGPKALAAFKRANDTFKAGQDRIEGAITKLLGNDKGATPERAATLLRNIAQDGKGASDFATLMDIKRTLRPEEWGQVSNGLVRLLGQPANAEGRAFSAQTFVRNFDTMAPEAKNLLFGGKSNPLRASLEEFTGVVRKIAENDSTRNTSGTGFSLGGALTSGAGVSAGAAAGGPVGAFLGLLAGHGLTAGAAKLWTNPVFIRWATGYARLAQNPANTAALANQVGKLTRIAETQTAITMDAKAIQDYLTKALSQSPTRAAASDNEQNGRRVPPQ